MHLKQTIKRGWQLSIFLALPFLANAGALDEAIDTQVNTDIAAQKSQEKIDNLSDETTDMLAEYRDVLRQTQSLKSYNDQLQSLVNSQQEEMASIAEQLNNIETTQHDIVPLMLKMIDVLQQFVSLDMPFLKQERQTRLEALTAMMGRADVSLAEKYRRIMEAYQVETEYGRTIEAYQADLEDGETKKTVDFLRIGRVSLYYITLDGKEAGMWDNDKKQWVVLSDDYIQSITDGLKVAKKQLPPDLMVLPVNTVGEKQ